MRVPTAIAVLLGVLFLAARPGTGGPERAVPDEELGLSPGEVGAVADPPEELTNRSDPGDRPPVPTDFPSQPPVVPHGIEDFLPITRKDNQCMDCHEVEEKLEGEPTPIPVSHYTDLRNRPEAPGDEVVGARYYCVACHVSPGGNDLLVENRFRGAP